MTPVRFRSCALALAFVTLLSAAPARAKVAVVIHHTPATTAERNKELSLRADIIAPAGAYLPTLYYRPVGETRWYSLPLLQVPGSLNLYAASVPGIFVTQDLEYYLEAYDTNLKGPGQAGSAKKPYVVKVVDPVVPPSQVVVRSDPPAAQLSVDGKAVGPTPWIGLLKPGSHDLLLKKEGFLEAASTLDVPEGRDLDTLRVLSPAAEQATFAVTSEPAGAKVTIDGQPLGTTPLIAPSPDGEHTLSVEKEGYARAEKKILFSKDRSIETAFNLDKLPPEPALAITSEPPGAKVTVDGKALGKTPFIGVVPAGDHALKIELDGRRPAEAQIIMPEDRDLDLRFTLEEAKVAHKPMLAVSSDPSGAVVDIDGKEVGKSPYLAELPAGEHKIKLTAPGFQPYEKKIRMPDSNDIEVTLALVPLPPPPGPSKVVLEAEPGDVAVDVDGKAAGKAPVEVELKAGPHVAKATKDGYRSTEERFTVVQGQGLQLKMTLQPVPKGATNPLLSVKVDPAGAQVAIDGKPSGVAPFSQQLPPGPHRIAVSKDGFKTREESFDLPKDKAFELRYAFVLEPVRKTVSLASAADLKKEEAAPKKPIVDPKTVQKERAAVARAEGNASAGAATAASSKVDEKALAQAKEAEELAQKLERQAMAAQADQATPRYFPMALAGLGIVSMSVGSLFYLSSRQVASSLADPSVDSVGRKTLLDEHDSDVQLGVWMGLGGVALATAGTVWAAWPRHLDFDLAAPKAGSGGDAPKVRLLAAPTNGGGEVGVGGSF